MVDSPDAPWRHDVSGRRSSEASGAEPATARTEHDVRRPAPRVPRAEQLRAWISWFGYGRLIGSAVAMVTVCAGAYWLVRTPPPPTEALLPRADTTVTVTSIAGAVQGTSTTAPSSATAPDVVVVYVAGAVEVAGVYRLDADARVDEAIRLAGGPAADADLDVVNLAAIVLDGSRIYVPRVGESVRPELTPTGPVDTAANSQPVVVNVNVATAAELDELPGVGPATAAAIVTERERHGPFLSADDLDRVPGIGPAKLDALRDLVTT